MHVLVCPVVYSRTRNAVAAQAGAVMAEAATAARTHFFIVNPPVWPCEGLR